MTRPAPSSEHQMSQHGEIERCPTQTPYVPPPVQPPIRAPPLSPAPAVAAATAARPEADSAARAIGHIAASCLRRTVARRTANPLAFLRAMGSDLVQLRAGPECSVTRDVLAPSKAQPIHGDGALVVHFVLGQEGNDSRS